MPDEQDRDGWYHIKVTRACEPNMYLHHTDEKDHIISKLVDGEWLEIQRTPLKDLTF